VKASSLNVLGSLASPAKADPARTNPAKALLIGLIRFYQVVISPGLPSRCKYYPSCSHYALGAVREYGAARGLVLAAWRILRCNPFSYGGYDPVERQRLFPIRLRASRAGDGGTGDYESGAADLHSVPYLHAAGDCRAVRHPDEQGHYRAVRG